MVPKEMFIGSMRPFSTPFYVAAESCPDMARMKSLFSLNIRDFPFGDFAVSDAVSFDCNSSAQYLFYAMFFASLQLPSGYATDACWMVPFWSVYCSLNVVVVGTMVGAMVGTRYGNRHDIPNCQGPV
jgi:hypothetical protein